MKIREHVAGKFSSDVASHRSLRKLKVYIVVDARIRGGISKRTICPGCKDFARISTTIIRSALIRCLHGRCLISRHINVLYLQSDGSEYHSKFHPSLATLL